MCIRDFSIAIADVVLVWPMWNIWSHSMKEFCDWFLDCVIEYFLKSLASLVKHSERERELRMHKAINHSNIQLIEKQSVCQSRKQIWKDRECIQLYIKTGQQTNTWIENEKCACALTVSVCLWLLKDEVFRNVHLPIYWIPCHLEVSTNFSGFLGNFLFISVLSGWH